jgi:PAS domain S-box-containing protein
MDGSIVKANGSAMRHLGLTYDELTGRYLADFESETIDEAGNPMPLTDYPVFRCLHSGRPEGPDTVGVRRRDGKVAWGIFTAIPLHRPDGQQDGSLVTFLDITERKDFEEALRESEERFRFAQASASAGTFDWDASDCLIWSDSAYELFGVEPGTALTSESWLAAIHAEDRERIRSEMRAIGAARQAEFRMEYRTEHPAAGLRWIATLGRCLYDADGHVARVAGIHLDITQLKNAQLALARSEERYRRLADHGAMGIWEVARDTGETVFANPALCRMLEVTPEELKGVDFRSFFSPESLKVLDRELARRSRGEASTYEVELIGKKGGRRRVMISGAPAIDPYTKLETLIGTFTDITDQKAAEDALRHAQKLDAVGRLASGVAHDFNNLLTAIFGFTSLARRTLSPNHPATKALDRVDEAARQASGVSKALLTFTRQDQSEKKPVRLCDVVEESARLLRRTLPSDIELRTIPPRSPVWVLADRTQLLQVVMNLAINARDAMPDGGRLTISVDTAPAQLNGDAATTAARLTVTDTGCGLTPEVLSRIFEPFFTTKPVGEGTGLGLPIIHGIVENHHGKIEIDSAPGRGATFRILLPQTEPAEQSEPGRSVIAPVGRGELILLADSHVYIRELMASMLLSMGYRVAQASDPAMLEEMALSDPPPRLLIMDADLAGSPPPRELIARIRSAAGGIPIVLMSARSEVADISADPETSILRKPFQMTELASAVNKALHTTPSTIQ